MTAARRRYHKSAKTKICWNGCVLAATSANSMKRKKNQEQLYVVRKYVMARSAAEAIEKERGTSVRDVWLDDEWRKTQHNDLVDAIGFELERYQQEED